MTDAEKLVRDAAAERHAWDKGIPHTLRDEPAWKYSIDDFIVGYNACAEYRDTPHASDMLVTCNQSDASQAKASAESSITRLESLAQLNVCEVCDSVDRDLFLKNGECIGCDRCLDDDDVTLPQATEASAEFPSEDMQAHVAMFYRILETNGLVSRKTIEELYMHGFAKGRASCEAEITELILNGEAQFEALKKYKTDTDNLTAKLRETKAELTGFIQLNDNNEACIIAQRNKLDEANAEIERLQSQINTHK